MSYSRKILAAANKIINDRRAFATAENKLRQTCMDAQIPEIADLRKKLAATGLAAAKAMTMGEDAEKYIEGLSEINLSVQNEISALLVKHGYPADWLEIPYKCKKCSDTGFSDGRFCSCRKQLLIELNRQSLFDSSPAAECRFDNFDLNYYSPNVSELTGYSPRSKMAEIFNFCREYSLDFDTHSSGLFFYGATGLGKTHLSLAVANEVINRGFGVKYYSAPELFSRIEKEKFGSNSTDTIDEALECDLLIIDDIGSEFITQFTVSAFYNILNSRLNCSMPVILSTNLSVEEMQAKYTQRITSRIIGSFTPLPFAGNDIRQIKRGEE